MHFEIISEIEGIESIALGGNIRDIMRLRKQFEKIFRMKK
jgi:hypothetical protein